MDMVGRERYWNKLRFQKKKHPNPHTVCSVSIPEHIIKRTGWEEGDSIGFQLYKGYAKSRYAIELRNLSKEEEPYASLTFLQAEEQNKNFLKKITPKNQKNFSEDIQIWINTLKEKKVRKRKKEQKEKVKQAEGKLNKLAIEALKKEIQYKKEINKKRIQQFKEGNKSRIDRTKAYNKHGLIRLKKFLKDDLKEREEMLQKLLKTPQKRPITPKPTQKHNK
jgi:hypothetical protein